MNRISKLTTAGILSIISGSMSLISAFLLIYAVVIGVFIYWFPLGYPVLLQVCLHVLYIYLVLIGAGAIVGGLFMLGRRRWLWALTGAMCACLFSRALGIPAIVFVVDGKDEFK